MKYLPEISLVLALTGLLGTFMISRGVRAGWLYMVAFQIPCGAYDIWTRQYGYLLTLAIGGWVYFSGWRRRARGGL